MSDFGKLGIIPKKGIKVSEDEKKVLDKLRKIKKDQWKAMRPVFEDLYEIAKAGGAIDFFKEPFEMYVNAVMDSFLLPFIPLLEIITPEFAETFEDTISAFTAQMEELNVLVTKLLAIDFGPLGDLADIIGGVVGFIGDVLSGKLQRDMMEWGQQFAYDVAMELRKAFGLEPAGDWDLVLEWMRDPIERLPGGRGGITPRRVPF